MEYYDGTKLLSMLDINGSKPEVYLCTTNRSFGKTTYFSRMLVNRYLAKGKKFGLIYRWNYELDNDCADKFFRGIKDLFFTGMTMTATKRATGIYYNLAINGYNCGYAFSLNQAENIKKYSHLMSDIDTLFMDEFQSEINKYVPDEITKLLSIHTSLARGGGKQVRYLPIILCSNSVSILNPYFVSLGISTNLRNDTKFLRGDGWVLEQGFGESVSQEQSGSAFNRAFKNSKYVSYASQNVYLNDNLAFIEKPTGKNSYILTVKYNGKNYGVRAYPDAGVIYVDNSADLTNPNKFSVTTDDHNINYVMLRQNRFFIENLRYYFDRGCIRFKDLQCKEAIIKALSY